MEAFTGEQPKVYSIAIVFSFATLQSHTRSV
jgi:hypothetical protein